MRTNVRLCDDEDLLRYESRLDDYIPRCGPEPDREPLRDWDNARALAVEEIERRLQARRAVKERFEAGRLSIRSKEDLRTCAAWFSLHFLFMDEDNRGDATGFFYRKSRYYLDRAGAELDRVALQVDYDRDNSDTIDSSEQDQPFPVAFIRG